MVKINAILVHRKKAFTAFTHFAFLFFMQTIKAIKYEKALNRARYKMRSPKIKIYRLLPPSDPCRPYTVQRTLGIVHPPMRLHTSSQLLLWALRRSSRCCRSRMSKTLNRELRSERIDGSKLSPGLCLCLRPTRDFLPKNQLSLRRRMFQK